MSKMLKIISISIFVGLFSGILSSLFLHGLSLVTLLRENYHWLIWGLPFFGLELALLIKYLPSHLNIGVPHIMKALDDEKIQVSPWMVLMVFFGALGTHLFGGSAGREGVGVIMGASISQLLPRLNQSFKESRVYLIHAGIAAGFSSIFGTPFAAILFSFELRSFKKLNPFLFLCTFLSSLMSYAASSFLGPAHTHYVVNFNYNSEIWLYVFIAGITSGLGANLFYWGVKLYAKLMVHFIPRMEFRLPVGGLLVSLLVFFTDSYSYIGIGTGVIARAFVGPMGIEDFFFKCLLTIMTIAVGFKGGEVTPLFFMGATMSNSCATYLGLTNFSLSSSLGMVALFGAAAGVPFASAMMAAELFGWEVGVISLASCLIAKVIMKRNSIYRE